MSFYVYLHKKPNGDVFYVGKGTKKRAWSKHSRNHYWNNVVTKYGGFTVEIVLAGIQEWYAFELEQELILKFKSLNYKLANISDGGEGISGLIATEETRRKISLKNKGLGNGRADACEYGFVNITTREEFFGTRHEFEKRFGLRVSDLFKSKVMTVYGWCLKENLDKVGKKLKYDPRLYLFKNKVTGEEVNLTRRDFNKKYNIESKGLFSGKLKSLHGWQVLGLSSDFT